MLGHFESAKTLASITRSSGTHSKATLASLTQHTDIRVMLLSMARWTQHARKDGKSALTVIGMMQNTMSRV